MLTDAGRETLVNSFVVAGILNHHAETGSEPARKALVEFEDQMAGVFASQYVSTPQDEFRRICISATIRHNPPVHA